MRMSPLLPKPSEASDASDVPSGQPSGIAKRTLPRVAVAPFRIRDLNRLFNARWGPMLPNDDGGRSDAFVMLCHLAQLADDPSKRMDHFLDLRTPWMTIGERCELKQVAFASDARWSADELAAIMNVYFQERSALGLTTIGAIDVDLTARKALRLKKQRERQRQSRQQKRMAPKPRLSASSQRASSIFATLKPGDWCPIAALCEELKGAPEFAGCEQSMRSAVHRAVKLGEANGTLITQIRSRVIGMPETLVARKGKR